VLLNITGSKQVLAEIVNEMPFLVWIHSITAGVDHILCPEIVDNNDILLTNAKGAVSCAMLAQPLPSCQGVRGVIVTLGVFSSSLAEYVMTACSYFAKDIPRLLHQQKECHWEKFCVRELRGATMGIVG
jgi:phosphoglycerate dehydrogenase-like enzyme